MKLYISETSDSVTIIDSIAETNNIILSWKLEESSGNVKNYEVDYILDGSVVESCSVTSVGGQESNQDCHINLEHSTDYIIMVTPYDIEDQEIGNPISTIQSTLEGQYIS